METVLVTGGAGFIGSYVVKALLEAGYRVRVFDNFTTGLQQRLPQDDKLEVIRGDLRNWKMVHDAVDGADHCIHLGGQPSVPVSMENPRVSFEINLLGFTNLLDGIRQRGFTGRLVYASDAGVYGNVLKHRQLKESAAKEAQFTSPYILEKQEIERMAELHTRLFGLQALGLRLFNVYGPGQPQTAPYANVVATFIEKLSNDEMLPLHGDGNQTRDFVYVEDVAKAFVKALKRSETGVVNVGTGENTSVKELGRQMAKIMGKEPNMMNTADRPGDVRHSCADTEYQQELFGNIVRTSLTDGLRKTITAMRQGGLFSE